ncbi:MAG: hypothetical protein P1V97_14925 [Planctomycetota bacterium]|nr:hypothetical protein [Planctomycetota bacterium]
MRASFVALARARGRLLKKRYGNGLSVVSLVVFCVILFYGGESMGGALFRAEKSAAYLSQTLPLMLASASLAMVLAFAWALRQSLYQARELTILLAQPVATSAFVLWRGVEALIALLILSLFSGAFLMGLYQGCEEAFPVAPALGAFASLIFMILGLALTLAPCLQRMAGRGVLGALGLVVLSAPFALPLLYVLGQGGGMSVEELPLGYLPGGSQALLIVAPDSSGVLLSVLWALLSPVIGFVWAQVGFDDLRDRAVGFPRGRPGIGGTWPTYVVEFFPGPVRGLLRRDFYLLVRGSFYRGLLVLGMLCLLPMVYRGLLADDSMNIFFMEFMTLLVFVVLVSATSFLCGADFPQHRRRQLIFEKAQPLTGRQVLWSRTSLAFLLSVPYGVAIIYFVWSHSRANINELTLVLAVKGFGLMACLCHYGAVMGMKAEADRSGAEGMAFPIIMGMLGMFMAFIVNIHWALLLVYPFIQGSASLQAARLYEFAEIEGGAEPS